MVDAQTNFSAPQEEQVSENIPQGNVKNKFPIKLLWGFLVLAILLTLGVVLYLFSQMDFGGDEDPDVGNNVPVIVEPVEVNPIKTYVNDEFDFSFQYNSEEQEFSQIPATEDQPPQFLITYKGPNQGDINTERDLNDGYIVKISAYSNISRDIYDLAERKKEKYTLECPDVVTIGKSFSRDIDGIQAQSFEVTNCPQNYVENFARFGPNIIEITQIYRGDIGFRQSYKAQTDQIVRSMEWLWDPEERPDIARFGNYQYRLRFIHPLLDTKCCDVTAPSLPNIKKVVVLADTERKDEEGRVLDKFGIFAYDPGRKPKPFKLFLNEQKQSLIQEFKVVEERNPSDLREETVNIGDHSGVKLINYAWWGEVIYADHPNPDVDQFFIFVIPKEASSEFRATVDQILDSFEFIMED